MPKFLDEPFSLPQFLLDPKMQSCWSEVLPRPGGKWQKSLFCKRSSPFEPFRLPNRVSRFERKIDPILLSFNNNSNNIDKSDCFLLLKLLERPARLGGSRSLPLLLVEQKEDIYVAHCLNRSVCLFYSYLLDLALTVDHGGC